MITYRLLGRWRDTKISLPATEHDRRISSERLTCKHCATVGYSITDYNDGNRVFIPFWSLMIVEVGSMAESADSTAQMGV